MMLKMTLFTMKSKNPKNKKGYVLSTILYIERLSHALVMIETKVVEVEFHPGPFSRC